MSKQNNSRHFDASVNDNNIFNDALTMSAMNALSPEDMQRYKEIGRQLYGTVNFKDSEILNKVPEPIYEAVAYITEQLKAGLHISTLEDNEKEVMKEAYGEEWYTKFGYVKEDLTDIITLNPDLQKIQSVFSKNK